MTAVVHGAIIDGLLGRRGTVSVNIGTFWADLAHFAFPIVGIHVEILVSKLLYHDAIIVISTTDDDPATIDSWFLHSTD